MLDNLYKKVVPDQIKYKIDLKMIDNNKKKSNEQIEKEINKLYERIFGRKINWENPSSYTEKLNYSKLYNADELKTKLTDKILVKDWVKERIDNVNIIPTIGIYNSFSDIEFNKLPNSFVIKANHDSGSTTIIKDKEKMNLKKIKSKYDYYLRREFAFVGYEMQYKNITPKLIIENNMGNSINDYKFLCFDGKPYYCWVDIDRFGNHKRNIYDLNWELQPFNQMTYGNSTKPVQKPKNFNKMIAIAKELSKGFDHVRVDLYEIGEDVYFGEMTFSNGNGFEPIYPDQYDYMLGELWTNIDLTTRGNKYEK